MPITTSRSASATCDIGFPGLSGYFHKDAIIESAFGQARWQGWVFGGRAPWAPA